MDKELNSFVGRNLITTPLYANDNIIKTDMLACVMEMVLSLDKLDNTDNMEDRSLSNVLRRYRVTSSKEFTSFEPVTLWYKRLKNGEFTSLALRITDQNDNGITGGPRMTIVLYIR